MSSEEKNEHKDWKPVKNKLYERLESLVEDGLGYWNEDGEFCHTQYIKPAKDFNDGDR